jgi:hypothetical protein
MMNHFHNKNILAFRGFNELHQFNLIFIVSSRFILKICKHKLNFFEIFIQYKYWVGIQF